MEKKSVTVFSAKLLLFIFILWLSIVILFFKPQFNILDNVNVLFHEAGHIIFSPFGDFLQYLGGTLMELIIPIGITLYFIFRGEWFSSSVTAFWTGENFTYISYYAADAQKKVLPLIGDDHDWTYILGRLHLIGNAEIIGQIIFYIGASIIIASIISMSLYLVNYNLSLKNPS